MPLRIVVDRDEVARIARAHDMRRLRIFGSAVSGAFDATKSDVDLLVELEPDVDDPFEAYFALKEDLEALFARPVDLVMADAIRNPHFRARVLVTAEKLYAA